MTIRKFRKKIKRKASNTSLVSLVINQLKNSRNSQSTLWLIPTAEVPLTKLCAKRSSTRRAAAALHRLDALLPRRGRRGGQGHARHDPHASVLQGRAGLHHHAGAIRGRARAHDGLRRGGAEAPRVCPTAPSCCAPATWASRRRRPTTSRSGCRGRTPFARSRAAPTAAISRRAA